MLRKAIKNFFGFDLPKPISDDQHLQDQRNLVRGIVARLARGNISLQQGHYILDEDIEKLRERNRNLKFSK